MTHRINNGYQHLKQGILHDKICLLRICGPLDVPLIWCWDVSVQVITDCGFSLVGAILMLDELIITSIFFYSTSLQPAFPCLIVSCLSFPHQLVSQLGLGNQVGSTTDHL